MKQENGDGYCAGCDNPGCRRGGCQGRRPGKVCLKCTGLGTLPLPHPGRSKRCSQCGGTGRQGA